VRLSCLFATGATCVAASTAFVAAGAKDESSPIFGVTIPPGYREWELIAVAHEAGLEELRGIVGSHRDKSLSVGSTAISRRGIVAKIAWKQVPLLHAPFAGAFGPGMATTAQFMVKDSKKYAAIGG
jgi:Cytochrome P460